MTETGGSTALPKTALTLSPSEFETYLRIAREQKVYAFKLGPEGVAVQFSPEVVGSTGQPALEADIKTRGGWKRGPDLDQDPELDTQ